MAKFIRVTTREDEKLLINISHLVHVSNVESENESICYIQTINGGIYVKESSTEVEKLLSNHGAM